MPDKKSDEKQLMLDAIFHTSVYGILTVGFEEPVKVISMNRPFERMFGVHGEDFVGGAVSDLMASLRTCFDGEDLTRFDRYQKELLAAGESVDGRSLNVTRPVPAKLALFGSPVYNEEEKPIGRILTFRDITEKDNLQRETRESHERYKNLVEGVSEIVYTLGGNGVFTFVNHAVVESLGYTPAELVGRPFLEIVHPEDRPVQKKVVENRLGGMPCEDHEFERAVEVRLVAKSGEVKFFRIRGFAVLEDCRVISAQGIAIDITADKKLDEQLRKYSAELEAKVRERTERLEYANQQLAALNSVSNELRSVQNEEGLFDLIPRKLSEALDFDRVNLALLEDGVPRIRSHYWPKDEERFDEFQKQFDAFREKIKKGEAELPGPLKQCIEQCRTVFVREAKEMFEWTRVHDDPPTRKSIAFVPIEFHGTVIGFIAGNLEHHERDMGQQDIDKLETFVNIVNTTLDNIRHHNELERLVSERTKELRETQAQLVQSEKMAALGSLVAGIAHEINNPISAVNSNVDITNRCLETISAVVESSTSLEEIRANRSFRQSLEILRENTDLAATASERIVQIVRSLKNFARLDEAEFQKTDIHQGLDSTLTLIHHEIKNKVRIEKRYGKVPSIPAFPNQLNQVFMNILVNAAQSIESQGTITLETSARAGKVYVRISDTGKGIPARNLKNIFDPGFTTKSSGVGTGLGLSISYNIIQKHRGKIEVTSEVGKGTTFLITLPIEPSKEPVRLDAIAHDASPT